MKALLCPPFLASLPRAKDAQLVYVNGRLCGRCLVHKRINRAYKDVWEQASVCSDFGVLGPSAPAPLQTSANAAHSGSVGGDDRQTAGGMGGQVHFPQRKRRRGEDGPSILAPNKKCPVFLVRITCPPEDCSFAEPLGHGDGAAVEFASW